MRHLFWKSIREPFERSNERALCSIANPSQTVYGFQRSDRGSLRRALEITQVQTLSSASSKPIFVLLESWKFQYGSCGTFPTRPNVTYTNSRVWFKYLCTVPQIMNISSRALPQEVLSGRKQKCGILKRPLIYIALTLNVYFISWVITGNTWIKLDW